MKPSHILVRKNVEKSIRGENSVMLEIPLTDENVPFELVPARIAHDMWAFGMTLYNMCAGVSFFRANNEDNLDRSQLIELASWDEDVKRNRLKEVKDKHARALLYRVLSSDWQRRPKSWEHVLAHPFLNKDKKPARMEGEEALWDVFISYRVASDVFHAETIYNALTRRGLRVWWDKKCLKEGQGHLILVLKP